MALSLDEINPYGRIKKPSHNKLIRLIGTELTKRGYQVKNNLIIKNGKKDVGEIDLFALTEDRIEVYEVKSCYSKTTRKKVLEQLKRDFEYLSKEYSNMPIELYAVYPHSIKRITSLEDLF